MVNTLTKGQAKVGKIIGQVAASAGEISSTEVSIANTKILIGSTSGISAAYALSGDVTMTNAGAVTIGAKKVTAAKTAIANTKVLIGSTSGAAAEYALSGDVTMTNAGVVTIGSGKVTDSKSVADVTTDASTAPTVGSVTDINGVHELSNSSTGVLNRVYAGSAVSVTTKGRYMTFFAVTANNSSAKFIMVKSTAATFDGTNKVVKFTAAGQHCSVVAASTIRWYVVNKSTGLTFSGTT